MTTLVGNIEQSPSSKTFLRRSQLKLQRMGLVLPLEMLLFMAAYSNIVVRGFSAVPATAWGVRTKPAIPITTTFSGGRRNSVSIDRCKITSTESSATTTLMAGLFGEQAKDNNQNHTYISSTSVSIINRILFFDCLCIAILNFEIVENVLWWLCPTLQ